VGILRRNEEKGVELSCAVKVPVSLKSFSREVIYRTCYSFTDKAYLWLEPGDGEEIIVALTPKRAGEYIETLSGDFGNALIDYALRHQVSQETRNVRDALIRSALSGAVPNG
jgi:His-Xaa-Ser system protein HxsD